MNLSRVRAPRPSALLPLVLTLVLALTWWAAPATAADDASPPDDGVSVASIGQCRTGLVCVWSSANFGGTFASTGSHSWDPTNIDTARSVRNRSIFAARLFSEPDGTGSWTCIAPGAVRSSTSVGAASMRLLVTTSC